MRVFSMRLMTRVLMVGLLALTSVGAQAQEAEQGVQQATATDILISIRPHDQPDGSRFETEIEAGDSVELTAVLENFGADPIQLRTFSSDVVPMVNGGMQMADRDSEKTGTTLWMEFDTEEFTLMPGEAIERPLSISVPEGTLPGQYVNGVALETVNPTSPAGGGSIETYFRKVVSVYITVPGPVTPEFTIGEPQLQNAVGATAITIPVTNSGNVRLVFSGDVTLYDGNGSQVFNGGFLTQPIYMGQATSIRVMVPAVMPSGEYHLSYTVIDLEYDNTVSSEMYAVLLHDLEAEITSSLNFESVSVAPNDDPIVFADVSVGVSSFDTNYASTRLTMSVYHDGNLVEEFVLAENLSIGSGSTNTVSQRYLPIDNWKSGTYTFSLKLESTDGGSTGLLLEEEDVATLEVP